MIEYRLVLTSAILSVIVANGLAWPQENSTYNSARQQLAPWVEADNGVNIQNPPITPARGAPLPINTKTAQELKKSDELIDGFEVTGSPQFILNTTKALGYLSLTSYYGQIKEYIGVIKEFECSGMNVYAAKPTFEVGQATWQSDTIWYAGTIAHDSYHSKLYSDAKAANHGHEPADDTWSGTEAEKKCLGFQLLVLQDLGADQKTLDYITELMKDPTYQNIGAGELNVCLGRNWL